MRTDGRQEGMVRGTLRWFRRSNSLLGHGGEREGGLKDILGLSPVLRALDTQLPWSISSRHQ